MSNNLYRRRFARTSYNSVFAVRFAHPNTFSISQTRKTLDEMLTTGAKYKKRKYVKSKEVKNANKKFL